MRKIQPRFICTSFFLALMYCLPSAAQVATGTPPFGSFAGGPDVINLANLNSHLAIPVIHKTGRGTNFTYDLSYDSSVWYPVGASGSQLWEPVSNFGWHGVTEVLTGYVSAPESPKNRVLPPHGNVMQTTYERYAYHDAFGTTHPLPVFRTSSNTCANQTYTVLNLAAVLDGSGYSIQAAGPAVTITSKSGATIGAPFQVTTGPGGLTDQNGNEISVNSSGVFTDTLGTTDALTEAGGAPPKPIWHVYVIRAASRRYP